MAGPVPFVLTPRDLNILLMVYEFRGVTADHIRCRFFPNPTTGAIKSCYRRIAALVAAGYLSSRRLPALSGIGSGKAFLLPGPAARPVLAKMLGLTRSELARIRLQAPSVINHHMALIDTRLAFERAAENSRRFTLVEWNGDGDLVIRVKDPLTKESVTLIPDASFTLALRGSNQTQTFYLEQDLGTVPPKRLRPRLRGYLVHAQETPTPVLFVVPDAQRQAAIARWASEEAARLNADPTLFWLTIAEHITEHQVLSAPIWQVAGGPPALALDALATPAPPAPPILTPKPHILAGVSAR